MDRLNIPLKELLMLAANLKSEHGENQEYDRALVELCCDALGRSMDEKNEVAVMLDIQNWGAE